MGADPKHANPLLPADLVIDHSVQVDQFGTDDAFDFNAAARIPAQPRALRVAALGADGLPQFPRGAARYRHRAPGEPGISGLGGVHQRTTAPAPIPDSVVGTDSHTTMINGLGVLGWGVGGIEAEACMLGQPVSMLLPPVVGFKLHGKLPEGATATDLVLTITQMLRKKGVVGKFVEFYGTGLSALSLADRATVANMAPEYGATMGFFPVDEETLDYLRFTNRDAELIALVEAYTKEQGLFRTDAHAGPGLLPTRWSSILLPSMPSHGRAEAPAGPRGSAAMSRRICRGAFRGAAEDRRSGNQRRTAHH